MNQVRKTEEPCFSRILVRATNWVGDAVMCLPALRAIRERFPSAHIAILARPWVAALYERESFADSVILLHAGRGAVDWRGKWRAAQQLRARKFDCAILLQNAFEAAMLAWLAGIPRRIGYNRDRRGWLLTDPIRVPAAGEIPRHERFYYLELLRRAHLSESLGASDTIHLDAQADARESGARKLAKLGLPAKIVGVSPGAAFGNAKRWLPERFGEAASLLAAGLGGGVAVFGSESEWPLCELVAGLVAGRGIPVRNFAGATKLGEFIEYAAACDLYLTNDSGAMHISSAVGVPTVAVFGATDDAGTGPAGKHSRVVREPVECSPCLLRECPIDHRCMTRVTVDRVVQAALGLINPDAKGDGAAF
jgi:heptosyltransferase-2